jgi:hypothetical protein
MRASPDHIAELRVAGEKSDIGVLLKILRNHPALARDKALALYGAIGKKGSVMQTSDRRDAAISIAPRIFMLVGVVVRWGELLWGKVLAIDTKFHLDFQLKIVGNFPR